MSKLFIGLLSAGHVVTPPVQHAVTALTPSSAASVALGVIKLLA